MALGGHLWTLRPWLAHQLRPLRAPASVPWTTVVHDPELGDVRLRGLLSAPAGARALVVIVHGLGGDAAAPYAIAAAAAAVRDGLAVLRLNLRGAGHDCDDFYNAGLTADLRAALASPELAGYPRLFVLGYSLGGHLTLRYGTEGVDPRVRALVAVCPPIDLDLGAAAFDLPATSIYRRHVLADLKTMYASVVAHRARRGRHQARPLPPLALARRIDRIRTWDDHIIAPRFGFTSAEHYYAETSVGPRLHRLAVPALVIAATDDPMVQDHTTRPWLSRAHPLLDVRWMTTGGHVGFPPTLDLGLGGETGLDPQILRWMRKVGAS